MLILLIFILIHYNGIKKGGQRSLVRKTFKGFNFKELADNVSKASNKYNAKNLIGYSKSRYGATNKTAPVFSDAKAKSMELNIAQLAREGKAKGLTKSETIQAIRSLKQGTKAATGKDVGYYGKTKENGKTVTDSNLSAKEMKSIVKKAYGDPDSNKKSKVNISAKSVYVNGKKVKDPKDDDSKHPKKHPDKDTKDTKDTKKHQDKNGTKGSGSGSGGKGGGHGSRGSSSSGGGRSSSSGSGGGHGGSSSRGSHTSSSSSSHGSHSSSSSNGNGRGSKKNIISKSALQNSLNGTSTSHANVGKGINWDKVGKSIESANKKVNKWFKTGDTSNGGTKGKHILNPLAPIDKHPEVHYKGNKVIPNYKGATNQDPISKVLGKTSKNVKKQFSRFICILGFVA
jgi:hypothetical protein